MRLTTTKILSLIILSAAASFACSAATISEATEHKRDHYIAVEGIIAEGDFDNIVKMSEMFVNNGWPIRLLINSQGGDALEAMRIGHFVREMIGEVKVRGNYIKEGSQEIRYCYSSCVLIFIAAAKRNYEMDNEFYTPSGGLVMVNTENGPVHKIFPVIGIHRPYFDKAMYKTLNALEAKQGYKFIEIETRKYLSEMGAPDEFVNRMFRASSNEIDFLDKQEFLKYFGYEEPFLEEWFLSKCGDLDAAESKDYVDVSAERALRGDKQYIPPHLSKGYVKYLFDKDHKVQSCRETAILENQRSILNMIIKR